ncbi:MAG TPA: DUF1015 domain-containing protein [Acidiferrobacteraceae bacterium]|nr:DUF1015 domain-containing protein [Acidiferrobacteraceae bacterium]
MTLIRPFIGLRPATGFASDVTAPPYDVLNSDEARERADGRPWSFLHISKPEIDLAPGTDSYSDAVYAKGAENFARMLAAGIIERDAAPYYYIYRAVMGDHIQTGLVVAASVQAYNNGDIRRHEFTRPQKEDDRVRQIDTLNAQTGPVFLTYRHQGHVDVLIDEITANETDVSVSADDGVQHSLWVVRQPDTVDAITRAFDDIERLYIADGHHRSAAAARVAARRRETNPDHTGDESYNYFLAVIFPDNQVQILDYNRVVRDLNGLSQEDFIKEVSKTFSVEVCNGPVKPEQVGEVGMYLPGQWYRLTIDPQRIPHGDPVARLDVSLLADHLIDPILSISNPRVDTRIDFVGGIRGLDELERRVDSGDMAVAFALHPTGLDELMTVADADRVMPPKSTWFEPKLADGLVTHVLD